MFQIRHGKQSWVVEHGTGEFERHTVFANICIRFDLVPFELKHPATHDLLSHTILSKPGRRRRTQTKRPTCFSMLHSRASSRRRQRKRRLRSWASGRGLK